MEDILVLEKVEEKGGEVTVHFYGHPDSDSDSNKEPTSEAQIYWEMFRARPEVEAIMHGHDPVILENAGGILKRPGAVITERSAEYGIPKFKDEVMKVVKKDKDFIIAKDHGFFSLGKTFKEAGNRARKYKLLARLYK